MAGLRGAVCLRYVCSNVCGVKHILNHDTIKHVRSTDIRHLFISKMTLGSDLLLLSLNKLEYNVKFNSLVLWLCC